MELRHLRYFVALAHELHFGRAARSLHIAQPALSQQIRQLEEEIGVQLFRRNRRRVELTYGGSVFLTEARHILSRAEEAARAAQSAVRGEIGPLRVACGPIVSYVVLPLLLRRYRALFPQVHVHLRECLMTDVVRALEEGSADVGLMLPYFQAGALKRENILKVALRAVLPKNHALARKGPILLRQLADENFILFPHQPRSGYYERVLAVCHRAGYAPRIVEGVEHFRTVQLMVGAGYGVSLLPALPHTMGAQAFPVTHTALREPYATVELGMSCRVDETSSLVAAFMDVTRDTCRNLSPAPSLD